MNEGSEQQLDLRASHLFLFCEVDWKMPKTAENMARACSMSHFPKEQ